MATRAFEMDEIYLVMPYIFRINYIRWCVGIKRSMCFMGFWGFGEQYVN